jgi:hypothetical protein
LALPELRRQLDRAPDPAGFEVAKESGVDGSRFQAGGL